MEITTLVLSIVAIVVSIVALLFSIFSHFNKITHEFYKLINDSLKTHIFINIPKALSSFVDAEKRLVSPERYEDFSRSLLNLFEDISKTQYYNKIVFRYIVSNIVKIDDLAIKISESNECGNSDLKKLYRYIKYLFYKIKLFYFFL